MTATDDLLANNAEYAQDNRQYTIMSYFGGYDTSINGWRQDGTFTNWLYSSTPMLDDVAVMRVVVAPSAFAANSNDVRVRVEGS